MKSTKKILALLLAALLAVLTVPFAFAAGGVDGNITWSYDEATRTLTFSGNGDMNMHHPGYNPWQDYVETVEHVVIESGITALPSYAFEKCKALRSVSIADTVTSIGWEAFYLCESLKNVSLPSGLKEICEYAFQNCTALEQINLPNGIQTIGESAFYKSGLTELTIPGSLKRIENSSFSMLKALKSLVIEEGVEVIERSAFYGCEALSSVTIPRSVKTIEYYAFCMCSNISVVNYAGSTPDWENIDIGNYNDDLVNARNEPICPWCGEIHESFFGKIVGRFHEILCLFKGYKYGKYAGDPGMFADTRTFVPTLLRFFGIL